MPRFLLPPRPLVAPANLSPLTVALAPRRQGSHGSPFKGLFLKQASQTRPADKNLHNGWYLYVSYLLGAKGTSLIFFSSLPHPSLFLLNSLWLSLHHPRRWLPTTLHCTSTQGRSLASPVPEHPGQELPLDRVCHLRPLPLRFLVCQPEVVTVLTPASSVTSGGGRSQSWGQGMGEGGAPL